MEEGCCSGGPGPRLPLLPSLQATHPMDPKWLGKDHAQRRQDGCLPVGLFHLVLYLPHTGVMLWSSPPNLKGARLSAAEVKGMKTSRGSLAWTLPPAGAHGLGWVGLSPRRAGLQLKRGAPLDPLVSQAAAPSPVCYPSQSVLPLRAWDSLAGETHC